ncbi:MAG: sensor domain-containing diguanylate cyclase, partial [Rhizobiales bacterium]|nr:sensor domain-containing diguanylate cyclase [Hyphomicrobiales bacterium]
PIRERFWVDLMWLLLVALGSAGLALTIAELSLLQGVRTLMNTALRLKAGRMGTRVTLSPRVATELHELAASFNSMIAEFERLAYLDRLTGLPNRRFLERQMLTRGSERDKRGNLIPEALLVIDLDGFKPVNDIFGHAMGDKVLTAVARRIAAVASDRATVARLGGDEFVALIALPGAVDPRASARAFGDEIRCALHEPVEIDGNKFPVGASIGLALVPQDAETLAGALVIADAALYEAKRSGRNRVIDQAPSLVSEGEEDQDGLLEGHWTGLDLIGYGNKTA